MSNEHERTDNTACPGAGAPGAWLTRERAILALLEEMVERQKEMQALIDAIMKLRKETS